MKTVIFTIAEKEYGVAIEHVREVIRMKKFTPIPDAPDFVEGVISRRGKVMPLISMRKKMGIDSTDVALNRIIVTQINTHNVGFVVDDVSGVLDINAGTITPPDSVFKETVYLEGIAKIDKRLILITNLEKLLSATEKSKIGQVEQKVEVKKRGSKQTDEKK